MVENSTNPPDAPENHDITLYFEQMMARDKALSEKIASMIDLDKLLKPASRFEFINRLFEPNDAVEKWTKHLQDTLMGRSSRYYLDGTLVDEAQVEPEPSEVLIDEIEDRVTEVNEPVAQRHHLRIDVNGFLIDQDDPSRTHLLSPQMQRLLSGLKKIHQRTKILRDYAGYKNDAVFYQAVRRLNEIGFGVFKLTTKIAIGERSIGFRLAKHLSIDTDKRNSNIQ